MADEILETPLETPEVPATTAAPELQAAPPATRLVVTGTKTKREIELERQLDDTTGKLTAAERRQKEAEIIAAEKERENQELKKLPRETKPKKHNWLSPVIGSEEE